MDKLVMLIRVEKQEDYKEVEIITREAFWNLYEPGCEQHFLVHKLRSSKDFIRQLSLVVQADQKIIAYISYTKSIVHYQNESTLDTITFAPVSVDPNKQNQGIGSKLIRESLAIAKQLNYKAVIIMGYPSYYSRFGFKNSKDFNIKCQDGNYYIGLQVLELQPNYFLKDNEGVIKFSPDLNIDKAECTEYDKNFPSKQKYKTKSQQVFAIACSSKPGDHYQINLKNISNREKLLE